MNEQQFQKQLAMTIDNLPIEERQDMLKDYEEHFEAGKEVGKTEEEIVEALGNPEKIGKEILATFHVMQAETKTSTGNVLRAVWAGIGLGFFNLIIVLGPFIALAGVVIAGWVSSVAFVLSPILIPVNLVIYPGTFEWSDLFFMFTLCGLGMLIAAGMYYLTKGLMWIFLRYLRFNLSLVKGGLRA